MISSLFPVRILFRVLFYRGIVFTQAISVQRSISFLYDFLHLSLSFVTYVIIRSFARRERQIFKNFSYIHYLIFFFSFHNFWFIYPFELLFHAIAYDGSVSSKFNK